MKLLFFIFVSIALICYSLIFINFTCPMSQDLSSSFPTNNIQHHQRIFTYNRNSPLILITGFPGSGLALVKQLFNQNSKYYCNADISLLTTMITQQSKIMNSKLEMNRLNEAKINEDIINSAYSSFILEIFLPKNHYSEILCNTDNSGVFYANYLINSFPNLKFIFMVRDPRAIINSYMLSDRIFKNYKIDKMLPDEIYKKWLFVMEVMHTFCMSDIGRKSCLPVYFEELVIRPADTFKKIGHFLKLDINQEHLKLVSNFIDLGKISTFYTELPRLDEFNLNWTQINKYGFDSLNFLYPNLNFPNRHNTMHL